MSEDKAEVAPPARPSIPMATLMFLGSLPAVALLLYIYSLLGIAPVYMGFVFIVYWLGILQASPEQFLPSVTGALFGILLAWLLMGASVHWGVAGTVVGALLLAATVVCLIRGQLPLLANYAAMLFLTAGTIPEIKVGDNAIDMALATAIAAAFVGFLLLALPKMLASRKGTVATGG